MTDVIVIGAGGGGPVVAKELAARGLDVLVLEAGPRFADPENEWTHFEDDINNPITSPINSSFVLILVSVCSWSSPTNNSPFRKAAFNTGRSLLFSLRKLLMITAGSFGLSLNINAVTLCNES